jgi:hypothetical protein
VDVDVDVDVVVVVDVVGDGDGDEIAPKFVTALTPPSCAARSLRGSPVAPLSTCHSA